MMAPLHMCTHNFDTSASDASASASNCSTWGGGGSPTFLIQIFKQIKLL